MIEINLIPGSKKKRTGVSAGLSMPDFSGLLAKVKNPLLLAAVGSWAVALTLIGVVFTVETRRVAVLEEDSQRVEAEARRFQALINQKRREERLRDSLMTELNAIRAIDADRYVWPHILEEVTKALPDYTWLEALNVLAGGPADAADSLAPRQIRFLIDGRTADMGGYTRFLTQLASSPWIGNVVAGPTRAVVEAEKPVFSFTITAMFRRADSAFIRTVPVIESVR